MKAFFRFAGRVEFNGVARWMATVIIRGVSGWPTRLLVVADAVRLTARTTHNSGAKPNRWPRQSPIGVVAVVPWMAKTTRNNGARWLASPTHHANAKPRARIRKLLMAMPVATTLLLAGTGQATAQELSAENSSPEEYRELAYRLFVELIEINTTNTERGDNTAAAMAMANALREAGFPEEDVHVLVPEDAPTKGNLVARLRGRDSGIPPILLLAHIDVVEALKEDWADNLDPFTFTERDGYYYGRGVTDDKDEAAIYTANLIRMKQEGFIPDRDIIIALTADEEGGPRNGVQFLLAEHRELIDAAYALNEGGGGMERNGRKVSNNVQAAEKLYLSFFFTATNPGGHSSLPVKKNAIYDLSAALLAVQEYDFPVRLNEITSEFFGRSAEIVGGEMGDAMRRIVANPADEEAAAVLADEAGYNARLRTTCVATLLEGGHAQNALPQLARANVNCRIFPGHDPAEAEAKLTELAAPFGVAVEARGTPTPSPPSPLTDEVLGAISEVTEQMWPGVPVLPVMSTGATDGLYLRNAGIPVYGVSGLFGDMDDVRAHGQNERIRITSFFEGQEFLYRLVRALTGGGVA